MIRVSHLSTFERSGGAARAALRLHRALLAAGVGSTLVVHRQESDDPTVTGLDRRHGFASYYLPFQLERLASRWLGPDGEPWSMALAGRRLPRALHEAPCDVAHLHWVQYGFLRPESLRRLPCPLIWTLHDQWAFCGGEHYPLTRRFASGYRRQDRPSRGLDLDRWLFARKRRAYARIPSLTLVAPSRWMADEAARSTLLGDRPIEVIPNAVDVETFKPLGRAFSRAALSLPPDRALVLVSAISITSDRRKGWPQLEEALRRLAAARVDLEVVVAGVARGPALPVPAHYLGYLHDDVTIALAYSAADVFVCPSIQDNLPNTVLEALACGTPCVAFATGGLPDLVTHELDGYLARPHEPEDLAAGIGWVLSDHSLCARLGEAARAGAVRRFAPHIVAGQHLRLYERALGSPRDRGIRA